MSGEVSSYTARWLAAAQCIVIGPVCGFVTAGGRCPNLTTATRAQCLRLSERFFSFLKDLVNYLQG